MRSKDPISRETRKMKVKIPTGVGLLEAVEATEAEVIIMIEAVESIEVEVRQEASSGAALEPEVEELPIVDPEVDTAILGKKLNTLNQRRKRVTDQSH